MKWKDTEETMSMGDEPNTNEYFDEEHYSPWSDQKADKKVFKFGKVSLLVFLLAIGIVASLTALLMLLVGGGNGDGAVTPQYAALDDRIRQLEARLDKYEAIDEKVTRIWEQAKNYEKFEDRFNRSEASTSLRMDHLTMSLEALQKQINEKPKKPETTPAASSEKSAEPTKPVARIQYHQVVAGETLYSISRKYDLSVDQLLQINRMDKNSVIVPGQKLIVQEGRAE